MVSKEKPAAETIPKGFFQAKSITAYRILETKYSYPNWLRVNQMTSFLLKVPGTLKKILTNANISAKPVQVKSGLY